MPLWRRTTTEEPATPEHVLMCNPVYFRIVSIDNPGMDTDTQPDLEIAQMQWATIHNLYTKLGLRVSVVPPHPERQDMVFTANGAWGRKRQDTGESEYILSNFRHPSRVREKEHFRRALNTYGYKTFELPEHVPFEGQGDIVTTNKAYLFGNGIRSSSEAVDYVRRMLELDKPVLPVKLVDPRFYHLDTCCMSLRGTKEDALMYVPEAFDEESLEVVRELDVSNKLEISARSALAEAMPCNSVFVDDIVLLNVPFEHYSDEAFSLSEAGEFLTDAHTDVRYKEILRTCEDYIDVMRFLWEMGYEIIPVYTSEFKKSGGGVRCLTLFLD
ncbi:MAG: arginine deiminase-related protein [Candidatus Spechtbacterales bacterium]|nr:arginine deiminase-related protein [Candidatus Spechtbacterales bacterium]